MRARPNYRHFHAVLLEAAQERHLRDEMGVGPDGNPESGWVAFEREVMHREVNRVRAENGLAAIPIEEVARAEGMANGHSDYATKYALYCAELAADILWPAP